MSARRNRQKFIPVDFPSSIKQEDKIPNPLRRYSITLHASKYFVTGSEEMRFHQSTFMYQSSFMYSKFYIEKKARRWEESWVTKRNFSREIPHELWRARSLFMYLSAYELKRKALHSIEKVFTQYLGKKSAEARREKTHLTNFIRLWLKNGKSLSIYEGKMKS